jgi:cell division protein FtsW (lipid II flippase)
MLELHYSSINNFFALLNIVCISSRLSILYGVIKNYSFKVALTFSSLQYAYIYSESVSTTSKGANFGRGEGGVVDKRNSSPSAAATVDPPSM